MRVPHRRSLSVIAAISLGTGVLLSASAAHADVYSNAEINPSADTSDSGCPTTQSSTGQTTVPFAENGGPATNAATLHTVGTDSSDPTDTVTQDLSDTTTAELTSAGGSVAAMRFASTGFVHSTVPVATADCASRDSVENDVRFDFTVTTPGYLSFTFAMSGPTYAEFEIESDGDQESYVDIEDEYNTVASSHSVYLVAGDYSGYYESYPYTNRTSPVLGDGSTSSRVDASFTPDGTPAPAPPSAPVTTPKGVQATPSAGKGLGYATLPLARSCATGTLVENVTSSRKAAKSIEKVSVFVDGVKAVTVKKPKPGQSLTVPLADTGTTRAVKTVVTTSKGKHHIKHHKKHKTYTSSTTYQPCS